MLFIPVTVILIIMLSEWSGIANYTDYVKFSDNEKTKLIYSAYLHDLGKSTYQSILISTGKLVMKNERDEKAPCR